MPLRVPLGPPRLAHAPRRRAPSSVVMHDADASLLHRVALRRTCSSTTLTRSETTRCPTFHRDVPSSMRVMRTRFPVYTLILYLSSGPMCPAATSCHHEDLETLASLRGVRKPRPLLRAASYFLSAPLMITPRASPAQSRPHSARSSPIDFYNNA